MNTCDISFEKKGALSSNRQYIEPHMDVLCFDGQVGTAGSIIDTSGHNPGPFKPTSLDSNLLPNE